MISYDPEDEPLAMQGDLHGSLALVVSPQHRLAKRKTVTITELGSETFIAHNVVSPYRDLVLREFQRTKCR